MVRVIVTEIESCEDCGEILTPNGVVSALSRRLGRLLDVREIDRCPEVGDGDVALLSDSALAVDLLHFSSGKLLDSFAGLRVMLVIFLAQPLRALHPLRFSIYNLSDVIVNVERTMSLENTTA